MSKWITNKNQMKKFLKSLSKEDTFVIEFESSFSPRYATVEKIENRQIRMFDTKGQGYAKIQVKPDPSKNHTEGWYILEDQNTNRLLCDKVGPGPKYINRINPDTLNVNYSNNITLVAECQECGNTIPMPVDKSDGPYNKRSLIKKGNDTVTPCCHSKNWESKMKHN